MSQIINAFKLSLKYLKNYPKFWFFLFLRAITTVADISIPLIIGYIIVLFSNNAPVSQIYFWTGLLAFILIINPYLDNISFKNAWFISFRVAHDFRRDAVKRLKFVGLSFWQNHNRGNVMKVIDQTFDHVIYLTGMINHTFIPFFGKIIVIFISTTIIDPVISILFLIDALFFVVNLRLNVPKESEAGIKERKAQEVVYGRINEYLTNYKTVLYLNLFDRQNKEIFSVNEAAYKAYKQREIFSALKWYINNQTHAICIAIIIIYSIWQVSLGRLEVGMVTTIFFFSLRIAENMTSFVWQLTELVKFSNSIKRYDDTFEGVEETKAEVEVKKIDFDQLVLRDVSLQQQDRETLRDVNLTINKDEKVAVVGFTGSGKTTLIDIILKANTSYSGDIFINEYDYQNLHVSDIAKVYSIVPQEVQLFAGTLKDNIIISGDTSDKELKKVITVASLESLVQKLPEGVNSHIQEGSANISGGERQRIGVARALLQKHPFMILDEATASLDPKTEREVITNIINEYPELTMLYITHKYSLLNLFDHIIVMNDGAIIEQGSFKSLIKKGGLFKDLYEASQMQ